MTKQKFKDSPLLNLPDEIKLHIMSFLNKKDLVIASQVCKNLNILSKDKSLNIVPDYARAGEPDIMVEKVFAITQSADKRYLGILTKELSDNFVLIDAASDTVITKITVNSYLNADTINLKLTPNNKYLIVNYHATTHIDNTGAIIQRCRSYIDVWDLENKSLISTFENLPNNPLNDLPQLQIETLSNEQFLIHEIYHWFLMTGKVIEYQNIYLYDINEKKPQIIFADDRNIKQSDIKYSKACLSPNKKLFARINNEHLNIYDIPTGTKIKSI